MTTPAPSTPDADSIPRELQFFAPSGGLGGSVTYLVLGAAMCLLGAVIVFLGHAGGAQFGIGALFLFIGVQKRRKAAVRLTPEGVAVKLSIFGREQKIAYAEISGIDHSKPGHLWVHSKARALRLNHWMIGREDLEELTKQLKLRAKSAPSI